MQEVHLVGREGFCLLDEHRFAGVEKAVSSIFQVIFCCGTVRPQPDEPCQLLHIRRVSVRYLANLARKFRRDAFPGVREFAADIFAPVRLTDFLEVEYVPEPVERVALVLKHLLHHVLLAAVETICHIALMLPDTAQFFLKSQ